MAMFNPALQRQKQLQASVSSAQPQQTAAPKPAATPAPAPAPAATPAPTATASPAKTATATPGAMPARMFQVPGGPPPPPPGFGTPKTMPAGIGQTSSVISQRGGASSTRPVPVGVGGGTGAGLNPWAGVTLPQAVSQTKPGPGFAQAAPNDPAAQQGQQGAADTGAAKSATPTPDANDQKANDQWEAILAALGGGLDAQLGDIGQQQSLNARRASEMNALAGNSVGGAFGAGQAQAQLGGMAMRQNAIAENSKRQVEARMSYLQMLQDRAAQQERLASSAEEAQKARDDQERIEEEKNRTEIMMQLIASGQTLDPATVESIMNGTYTGTGSETASGTPGVSPEASGTGVTATNGGYNITGADGQQQFVSQQQADQAVFRYADMFYGRGTQQLPPGAYEAILSWAISHPGAGDTSADFASLNSYLQSQGISGLTPTGEWA